MTEHAFPPLRLNNKCAIVVLLLSPGAPVETPLLQLRIIGIFVISLFRLSCGLMITFAHGECRVSLGSCGSPTVFFQSRSVLLYLHTWAYPAPNHSHDSQVVHLRGFSALHSFPTLSQCGCSSRKTFDGHGCRGSSLLDEKKLPRGGGRAPSHGVSPPTVPTVGAFEPDPFPFRKGNETGGTSVQARNVARVGVGARTLVSFRHVRHGRTRRFAWDEEVL